MTPPFLFILQPRQGFLDYQPTFFFYTCVNVHEGGISSTPFLFSEIDSSSLIFTKSVLYSHTRYKIIPPKTTHTQKKSSQQFILYTIIF